MSMSETPSMMNNWGTPKLEVPNGIGNYRVKSSLTKPSLLSPDGMSTNVRGDTNFLGEFTNPNRSLGGGLSVPDAPVTGATPDLGLGGKWMDGAKIGFGVAEVGLGVWNALEQSKMNKFMRGYYGDQMKMQRADFANNAKSANQSLEQRQKTALSAQGFGFDSAENKAGTASHMDKWGVKETF